MTAKKLETYLIDTSSHSTSLEAYLKCPAEAFLLYVCDAHDAFHHCENKFTKKADGKYNKDSEDSLRIISCSILGSIMGHFETYQKSLLAGLIEISSCFPKFDAEVFIKYFGKHCGGDISIEVGRALSLRGADAKIGYLIADSLSGWHNAKRVGSFFKALDIKKDVYTADVVSDIEVLWQLRHSVVHTGAWLSAPDAQKVKRLRKFGNKPIVFDHRFVNAICRRFHKIVKHANKILLEEGTALLGANPPASSVNGLSTFLAVRSPKNVWLT